MPNPVMPAGIKPVVSNYSIDDPGGVVRTDVAGGMPRYGLDWDRGAQRFSVTLILDALQFSVWTAFYHHTIRKGAVTFDMPLDSGFGVSPHAVNIVPGSYSAARTSGIMMVVQFVVETENQVYDMTTADASSLVDLYNQYGAYSNMLLDRLGQFANAETNVLDF
ncbi:hypothetical protein [Noviherbaspirillum autotrophicum]|uniref:Uncharacterized protein n=1 Tax=Noviherbaspirillum autotrophicum TaxID=709839 RepID=A0A0C2BHW1_9BURK|nr:hypothetical protein [Noviherbaspirillum autotrophicum]KIF80773.1 hypothetical protein TSA66_07980 [Noviherbaspirillum autotrophicum]KIF80810.1 hypothetical protein TSA66_08225 [Noviherbaspirillum autotrophicum]KIF84035.1 hypothetical protein TSA66_00915 [Noviherbaspirillum autotrophicum]